MSRIYDSWEKLVGAVLRREKDRQLALCESFSSSSSVDVSSRSSCSFDPFVGDIHVFAGQSNWDDGILSMTEMRPGLIGKLSFENSDGKFDPKHPSSCLLLFLRGVVAFDFGVMKEATRNFRPAMTVGEGEFGSCFKGWIHEHSMAAVEPESGLAVAVKVWRWEKLDMGDDWSLSAPGFGGHSNWLNEINYTSLLRHPNLVKLLGYSFNGGDRILVYEFMTRGSLDNHLFRGGQHSLPWATRIKVAIGTARALAFLHSLEIPVIHRNITSSVILLDSDFNAKLSDFGYATDGPTGDNTYVSTQVVGTYGYAAPEYISTGYLTTRCGVYSFGVVLLELISGFRVIDRKRPKEKHNLMKWAVPYFKDKRKLPRIIDSRLKGEYPHKEAHKAAKIALQCVSSNPRLRPKMSEVVAALETL